MMRNKAEKPLKVVIVVTFTYPFIGSGIGNVARVQGEQLAKAGHAVTLISARIPESEKIFVYNKVAYIKLWSLDFLSKYSVPVPLMFFNLKALQAMAFADVIHVHDMLYPSSFFAVLFGKVFRKKVVLTQHVPHVTYTSKLINFIEKCIFSTMGLWTLAMADDVVVLTKQVFDWLKHYRKSIIFLPNGVDCELFSKPSDAEKRSIRKAFNLPLDAFIVLFIGRLVPKKRFELVYKAKNASYMTLIVGGGDRPDWMKEDEAVRIFGPRQQDELTLFYKASDAFLLPSYGEGFPLALQEAMATGLPIITSFDNNLDASVDSPYISYIDPTVQAIQTAVSSLQKNTDLYQKMSDYSEQTAHASYSWKANIEVLVDLYTK